MLTTHVAVALSLLPGRTRFDVAARIRARRPDLLSAPCVAGPSLEHLVTEVAPELAAESALPQRLHVAADAALRRAARGGIAPVTLADPGYPARLRVIADPPLVVWTRGAADALRTPAVAIVGARAATPAGREMARWLAADLAAEGIVVVSGLARGIDAAAHEGALATGRTVAVLGAGTDVIYPSCHRELAERAAARGALVSEFVPGTAPHAHHFPLMNRIISGLALGVVVVEGSDRRSLEIQTGQHIADLGSGTGSFTFRLADAVGSAGKVYAVDVDPGMNTYVEKETRKRGYRNIEVILAQYHDPLIPGDGVDLIFTCNTYHHIKDRVTYFTQAQKYLRPGGRVAIIDFNDKGWFFKIFRHFTTSEVIKKEMELAGYHLQHEFNFLPRQHFLVFSQDKK